MAPSPDTFYTVLESVLIFVAFGIAGETLIYFLRRSADHTVGRLGATRLLHQLIRIGWIGLAALFVLTLWDVASDILTAAVVGIVALVVSLGLQNTISNMVSGMFLLNDGAIRVGDRIEHFAIKGVVVRVALRNTWVRTESGQIAVVGNLKLADGPTLNYDLRERFEASRRSPLPSRFLSRKKTTPPPETAPK